ncbi:tRNA preQ1(34) S-adenosylmethionine ribosyltransferase-isomerase QueA [Kozakia baliensis]|uniref:tRNA preQ1(34) S-adenosylmethionine ribosyltransferase-isomerase QueA n=1 Tax=Kozakia baliensis TaxID=153496 RepID=UPI00345BE232
MQISDFDFDLPRENIALEPARPRDSARLLHVTPGAPLAEAQVRDLPRLLRPGDLLIANDTAVIRAQLAAQRGEAKIGLTLDRILPGGDWHALARNARKLKPQDILTFGDDPVTATIIENEGDGAIRLRFSVESEEFDAFLKRVGALALPPYIDRPFGPTAQDDVDYRTIFSRQKGAVAAPTAGLHFTPELLAALDEAGIQRRTLTLHVGAGTFLPVRGDDIASHKMHAEWGEIDEETAAIINQTRARGGRVVAVGTTSLRLLESAADESGFVRPWRGETAIFIKPGYQFRVVDVLMTNFHLPRSTLFMLVCALAGTETMRAAYAYAIAHHFRFYSYGDACFLERAR